MLNMLKKLFNKKEDKPFDPYETFKCKVYNINSDRYIGEIEINFFEYKYKVTYDKNNRYVRSDKGDDN